MNDYWFELDVSLSQRQMLNSTEHAITFQLEALGKSVTLAAFGPILLNQADRLTFSCHGFCSFDEAHGAGLAFEKAVLVGGAIVAIGVDTGADHAAMSAEQDDQRTPGYRIRDERHGLTVYGGELQPSSFLADVRMVHLPEIGKFVQSICRAFSKELAIDDKQRLALELYGLSHFETSERARFLVLISCVEVLSGREPRSAEELSVLDSLVQVVRNSSLGEDEKNSLEGVLRDARSESIGKACRRLVGLHLGMKAQQRFKNSYAARSELLHSGTCHQDVNIGSEAFDMNYMVSALLNSILLPRVSPGVNA